MSLRIFTLRGYAILKIKKKKKKIEKVKVNLPFSFAYKYLVKDGGFCRKF